MRVVSQFRAWPKLCILLWKGTVMGKSAKKSSLAAEIVAMCIAVTMATALILSAVFIASTFVLHETLRFAQLRRIDLPNRTTSTSVRRRWLCAGLRNKFGVDKCVHWLCLQL